MLRRVFANLPGLLFFSTKCRGISPCSFRVYKRPVPAKHVYQNSFLHPRCTENQNQFSIDCLVNDCWLGEGWIIKIKKTAKVNTLENSVKCFSMCASTSLSEVSTVGNAKKKKKKKSQFNSFKKTNALWAKNFIPPPPHLIIVDTCCLYSWGCKSLLVTSDNCFLTYRFWLDNYVSLRQPTHVMPIHVRSHIQICWIKANIIFQELSRI